MSYLVDTNVVSELRKGQRCNPGVATWFGATSPDDLFLSAITAGEIRRGIESIRRRDERSAAVLEAWFSTVLVAYSDRLLPVDEVVAEQWGRFNVPDPLPVVDGLLAATAMVHGLTLVTRNIRDVERTGVDCLNPFSHG